MKDIQKLKIWTSLQEEGFQIKEIKHGNVVFGRGAIYLPDYKEDFPKVEILPLDNGRWKLSIDYFSHGTEWEGNPFEIGKLFVTEFEKFKKLTTQ